MVIQFPPTLLESVIDIRVVVSILCQTIMDDNGMEIIRSLLLLDVWFFKDLLNVFNLALEDVNLILGCIFKPF